MKLRVSQPSQNEGPLHEVNEELDELRWHHDHIRSRLETCRAIGSRIALAARESIERELDALARELGASNASTHAPLVTHQGALRQLYHALARLESAPDWHSAPGSLSRPLRDLTPLSYVPGYNDYQRGYLPWLKAHEQHFMRASQELLEGRALLCSSGMGAVQTALQFVLGRASRLLLGRRVYYETQSLLSLIGARDRLLPFDEAEQDHRRLGERISQGEALFVDTITLDQDALPIDLPRLYRLIQAHHREFTLVLDNTVPGPRLRIPPPPPGCRLLLVESLLKNYQGGLDLTAAGMLVVVASQDAAADRRLVHDLEVLRSTNGTNLSAPCARLLPMLPRSRILARLTRQARNAVLLAEGLRERCDIGLVEHAGLVFCAHRRADRLVAIIERLALARGIRVVCGTSFGFNDTRITLVPGEEGRLRFACGMEQEPAMNAILELVQQAVAAVEHAEVRQQCVHLSRFFPDYPQRTTASSEEQVALEQHLRAFERTVMNAIDGRSS